MIFKQTHFINVGPSWGKVILVSAGCIVGAVILYKLLETPKIVSKSNLTDKPKAETKKDDTSKS